MRRIFGLDVLRTVAISEVLLGHGMNIYVGVQAKKLFEGFYGFLGVELFFVLSGFLVGSIALDMFDRQPTPAGAWDFMVRRWLRTLPNYYLFLGVNAVLVMLLGGAAFDARYLLFLQNLFWNIPHFFEESWSLSVEELFYLVLPLLIVTLAAFSRSARALGLALCAALAAFTLVRLGYVAAVHPDFHAVVRRAAGLRLDSLMYGVLAAWLNRYAREAFLRRPKAMLVAGLLVTAAAVRAVFFLAPTAPGAPSHLIAASLALGGVSLGVAMMLPFLSAWQAAPGPVRAVVEWASRVSYSLYLCHLPTSRLLQAAGLHGGVAGMLIWMAASCAVATAIHLAFERPIMRLRDRLPGPTPRGGDAVAERAAA
jgi:peptidoglycan/LPS O-acetylase OafA/YrhL